MPTTRPASAPSHKSSIRITKRSTPSTTKLSPAKQACQVEPYLKFIEEKQSECTSNLETRVVETIRQTKDFVDTMLVCQPLSSMDAETTELITSMQKFEKPPSDMLTPAIKKPRPKTSVPVMRLKLENNNGIPASSIVKHPTRLIVQRIESAISLHLRKEVDSSLNQENLIESFQDKILINTESTHNFFYGLIEELACHFDGQPSTVGVGSLLRRLWNVYVNGLYIHVNRAKHLGLQYSESCEPKHTSSIQRHFTIPKLNHLQSFKVPSGQPSALPSEITPAKLYTVPHRRRSVCLVLGDTNDLDEIKCMLSAKVKAMRLELVSMQRLRESIFSSVMNGEAARKKDRERRLRLNLNLTPDQAKVLQQRYAASSQQHTNAAIVIQRVFRGKIAGKQCQLLRLVELMKVNTRHLFHQRLKSKELREHEPATKVTLNQLEEQLKCIVWEVGRLVRDLSLDWWKQSLSEERARLTWELNDTQDELKQLKLEVSILLQNCMTCLTVCTEKYVPMSILLQTGNHNYHSPPPQVDMTNKAAIEAVVHTNSCIEDFIFNKVHQMKTMTTVAVQTEQVIERSQSYYESLCALVELHSKPPDSNSDDDEDGLNDEQPQLNTKLSEILSSSKEPSQTKIKVKHSPGKHKKHKVKGTKRHRYRANNTLANVPPGFLSMFKVIGVTKGYKAHPMPLAQLKLLLHEIYNSRMRVEEYTQPLPEFIFQFFMRKYGLRNVAESHLIDLLTSLKKYWRHDCETHLFARFCCLKNTVPLSIDAFDFYICILAHIHNEDVRQLEPVIPYNRVPGLNRHAVESISKFEPRRMLQLINFQPDLAVMKIDECVNAYPNVVEGKVLGTSLSNITVDRNKLFAMYIQEFESVESQINTMLKSVFESADIDHNGELTIDEFNAIVQKIDPTPMWQVHQMYFDAVALTANTHTDTVTADAFVVVAKKQGLGTRAFPGLRRKAITDAPVLDPSLIDDFNTRNPSPLQTK